MKYKENGEWKEVVVKSNDTLPVGTEVDFDGDSVPSGWTAIERLYVKTKDSVSIANDTAVNVTDCSVTASRNGTALIIVNCSYASNSTGYRQLTLSKNGSVYNPSTTIKTPAVSNSNTALTTSIVDNLTAGDVIVPRVSQNSGGALSCDLKLWVVYL